MTIQTTAATLDHWLQPRVSGPVQTPPPSRGGTRVPSDEATIGEHSAQATGQCTETSPNRTEIFLSTCHHTRSSNTGTQHHSIMHPTTTQFTPAHHHNLVVSSQINAVHTCPPTRSGCLQPQRSSHLPTTTNRLPPTTTQFIPAHHHKQVASNHNAVHTCPPPQTVCLQPQRSSHLLTITNGLPSAPASSAIHHHSSTTSPFWQAEVAPQSSTSAPTIPRLDSSTLEPATNHFSHAQGMWNRTQVRPHQNATHAERPSRKSSQRKR